VGDRGALDSRQARAGGRAYMDVEEQETRSYWGNCKGEAAGREGGEKVSIYLYIHTHTHAHTHTHTHTHTNAHTHRHAPLHDGHPATTAQIDSATGTRTRVARVRAEYPNQLDYSGSCGVA
jgi:extradiol dioxygenase family protein